MRNSFWALERALRCIFLCSKKEQKKDVAAIPSAKAQIIWQDITDEEKFLVDFK